MDASGREMAEGKLCQTRANLSRVGGRVQVLFEAFATQALTHRSATETPRPLHRSAAVMNSRASGGQDRR